ncbi:MAG: S8 family serine peptidase, partial [Verrucomicrobiales bacterium]
LNVRGAWAITRGENTVIAVADSGLEENHPDLADRSRADLHQNFFNGTSAATPPGSMVSHSHGTSVAGLALATAGNNIGIAGVAPEAGLAGWVVLEENDGLSDEGYMDMYQFKSNAVTVQNHSWGKVGTALRTMSVLEKIGISNAVANGRSGKGVVMVRAAGNDRGIGSNANEQEVSNDPRIITVGAVRQDGKVTSYSQRGANVLVSAPSGETADGFSNIPSTDRQGGLGYNPTVISGSDSSDYAFGANGFSGTSAAAPQISGIVALMISANPALTVRDVQKILLLSSRHYDLTDSDLAQNGAGLQVSHNTGFGIPDAAVAVQLARSWVAPSKSTREDRYTRSGQIAIKIKPMVEFSGATLGLDSTVLAPPALPFLGTAPVTPVGPLPLVDVGQALGPITKDVRGKIALIQRGENFFYEKLTYATQAGAAGAIIYDNDNFDQTMIMGLTDFVTIPAVFIPQYAGEALADKLSSGASLSARLNLNSDADATVIEFDVPNGLSCEHVGVFLATSHTRRGDLRIVLQSPSGTRSVLQEKNLDTTVGPMSWTYWSARHFLEGSGGKWKLFVTDQQNDRNGAVLHAGLAVRGLPITDTDSDGLDDNWERTHFSNLRFTPRDDPNNDGVNNARHHALSTNPSAAPTIHVDLSPWKGSTARLSWSSGSGPTYQISRASTPEGPYQVVASVPGKPLETEYFLPTTSQTVFFKVTKR